MPKIAPSMYEERRRSVRALISAGIEKSGTDEEKLAKAVGIHAQTLQLKRKNPDTIKLGELWRMCDYLKVPRQAAIYLMLGIEVADEGKT